VWPDVEIGARLDQVEMDVEAVGEHQRRAVRALPAGDPPLKKGSSHEICIHTFDRG
jgi:hypothetical protein